MQIRLVKKQGQQQPKAEAPLNRSAMENKLRQEVTRWRDERKASHTKRLQSLIEM